MVLQRVAVMNRLLSRLHQIDPTRPQPRKLQRPRPQQMLDAYLAEQSGLMAELGRQELTDVARFTETIDGLTERISAQVHSLGSTLPDIPGCAELTAAKLISESGDVTRFRSEAAYARYVGIAPVPGWSGSTRDRMRVSHAGNRQLNAALHRVAIVQLAMPSSAGRAYFDRRRADGDSGATALRGLKRRLCRVVYNRLRDDQQRRQPKSWTTIGSASWHLAALSCGRAPREQRRRRHSARWRAARAVIIVGVDAAHCVGGQYLSRSRSSWDGKYSASAAAISTQRRLVAGSISAVRSMTPPGRRRPSNGTSITT